MAFPKDEVKRGDEGDGEGDAVPSTKGSGDNLPRAGVGGEGLYLISVVAAFLELVSNSTSRSLKSDIEGNHNDHNVSLKKSISEPNPSESVGPHSSSAETNPSVTGSQEMRKLVLHTRIINFFTLVLDLCRPKLLIRSEHDNKQKAIDCVKV